LADLARTSGVDQELLAALDRGEVNQLEPRVLLKLADALRLDSAFEFAGLFRMNELGTAFKAFGVGLFRSGTHSLSRIFRTYRSAHEYGLDISEQIARTIRDAEPRHSLLPALRQRYYGAALEMDAAYFHHFYFDLITEHFPCARIVVLIRDCYSWLDSVLNWFLNHRLGNPQADWRLLCGIREFRCQSAEQVLREVPPHLPAAMSHWALVTRSLLVANPERSLVLATHELGSSVPALASFLGVSESSLDRHSSHSNRSAQRFGLLGRIDSPMLTAQFEDICGPVMRRVFPGYTLRAYLDGTPPPALCRQTAAEVSRT